MSAGLGVAVVFYLMGAAAAAFVVEAVRLAERNAWHVALVLLWPLLLVAVAVAWVMARLGAPGFGGHR